jgi:hypothetical protein
MLHALLIVADTICGVVALAAGGLALRPPARGEPATFRFYLGALWLMIVFLLLVLALDWGTLDTMRHFLFGALAALALYMGWRGWSAFQTPGRRLLRVRAGRHPHPLPDGADHLPARAPGQQRGFDVCAASTESATSIWSTRRTCGRTSSSG